MQLKNKGHKFLLLKLPFFCTNITNVTNINILIDIKILQFKHH